MSQNKTEVKQPVSLAWILDPRLIESCMANGAHTPAPDAYIHIKRFPEILGRICIYCGLLYFEKRDVKPVEGKKEKGE